MEQKNGKNVLIIGNSAGEFSLAKKFSALEGIGKVFVASGNDAMKEFCTVVDIREDSVQELLEFALENAIDLTVAASEKAIEKDIASLFQQNGQMIFAPTAQSAGICLSKSTGKKFMYKNHIPCPKFGIFDKPSMALDYIKKSKMPIVVKTDNYQSNKPPVVCVLDTIAKNCVDELFDSGESKVVLEEFILGHEFSFYVVTDGYKALPIGTVATYKYELEGNGGSVNSGMGAFVPDYKVSNRVEQKIMQQVVYPTLHSLEKTQTPYVGILGVDCILTGDDTFQVIEFNSFLNSPDAQAILELLDENLYQLFEACAIGSFADDYNVVKVSESYAASCVLSAGKKQGSVIKGLENLDENTVVAHFNTHKNEDLKYETTGGRTLSLTRVARTLSRALDNLYEEVELVCFDGMRYRKDIGKS